MRSVCAAVCVVARGLSVEIAIIFTKSNTKFNQRLL